MRPCQEPSTANDAPDDYQEVLRSEPDVQIDDEAEPSRPGFCCTYAFSS